MMGTNWTKKLLMLLLASYAAANFILFILAWIGYGRMRRMASACSFEGVRCGGVRWIMHPLLSAVAGISFLCASLMLMNMLVSARKMAVDPLYVFRGVFITLLFLFPVVVLGWMPTALFVSAMDDLMPLAKEIGDVFMPHSSAGNLTATWRHVTAGIRHGKIVTLTGTFWLGTRAVAGITLLSHLNIILGSLIACVSAALAPATGIQVGVRGVPADDGA